MNSKKVLLFSAFAMSLGLASCVNEDYDLSNLDTTIGIKVKDLTVAMKLDEIKLGKMLDLKDGDQIKEVTDPITGKTIYAVVEEGDFKSDPINITDFSTDAPDITPITDALPLKYINQEVKKMLDQEIDKAVDEEINKQKAQKIAEIKAEKIAEYKAEYEKRQKTELDKAVDDYIKANYPGVPLTAEQKAQIRNALQPTVYAAVEEGFEKEYGFPYSQLEQHVAAEVEKQVTAEVEAQRPAIKEEKRNDPAVRAQAQSIAWSGIGDNDVFATYDISNSPTSFTASSDNVDKALRGLTYIKASSRIAMQLRLTNLENIIKVVVKDTKIQLPKGMDLDVVDNKGTYNKSTGVLSLGDVTVENGKYELAIQIKGFDTKEAGIKFVPGENGKPGSFDFSSSLYLMSGQVTITKKSFINNHTIFDLPDEAAYLCEPEMEDIKIESINGTISYEIDPPTINPVNMNSLPDILTDKGTNIVLGNPQIYLSVNNPIIADKLAPQLGLKLTAIRDNAADKAYELDKDATTGKPAILKLAKEQNIFCISPEKPSKMYEGFTGADHIGFKSLATVLSGDGMPTKLQVDVIEPKIPESQVTNFKLGRNIDPVEGKYTFFAPLNLGEGSVVQYCDTIDGWYDETMEKIDVKEVKLNAKVVSQLPLGATLTLVPIDEKGKKISSIQCSPVTLASHNNEQDVQFTLTSTTGIKGLDGVILNAKVVADGAEEALKPIDSINIKEIKVSVTGEYIEVDND